MRSPEKPKLGDVIEGKYKLLQLIGEGGMGQVYRARHLVLDRAVAVKVMPLEHTTDERLVQRFLQEAHAAAKVRHAHIVEILDAGTRTDGTPYIVQELLDGLTLDKFVEANGGRLPPAETLALLLPIVDAIAALHEAHILHRDIKPENVFLATVGSAQVPKLLDFGISRELESEVRLTTTGTAMGTPAYMSPEQVNGRKTLDARSDIWSIGVVLYEVLSGRLPFDGETAPAMFAAIANNEPVPLEFICPELPTRVVSLVRKCLERPPAARFRTARELEDAMSAAHSKLVRKGGSNGGAEGVATASASEAEPPSFPGFDLPPPPAPKKQAPVAAPLVAPRVVETPAQYDPSSAMLLGHELPNAALAPAPQGPSGLELGLAQTPLSNVALSAERRRGGRNRRRDEGRVGDLFGEWYVAAAILSAISAILTVVFHSFVEGPDLRTTLARLTAGAMDQETVVPRVFSGTLLVTFGIFTVASVGLWPRSIGRTLGYGGVLMMAAVWVGLPLAAVFGSVAPSDIVAWGAAIGFIGAGAELVARATEWWSNGRHRIYPVFLAGFGAAAFFGALRVMHGAPPKLPALLGAPSSHPATVVVPTIDLEQSHKPRGH